MPGLCFQLGAGAEENHGIAPRIPQAAHRMHGPMEDKTRICFRTGQEPQFRGTEFCHAEGFTQPTIRGLGMTLEFQGPSRGQGCLVTPLIAGPSEIPLIRKTTLMPGNHNSWKSSR